MTERRILLIISVFLLFTISTGAEMLSVVTINVWSGLDYEGTFRMGEYETEAVREGRYWRLIDGLKRLDPDIIAVNEANKLPRYARRLAKELNMDFVHSVGMGGIKVGNFGLPVNFREGDVILARKRFNMRSLGRKRLSGKGMINNFLSFHFAESNQVVGAVLHIEGRPLYVFNTHTHAGPPGETWFIDRLERMRVQGEITPEELASIRSWLVQDVAWREREISLLLDWIEAKVPTGDPVILLGDFNAAPAAKEMGQISRAGFLDSYSLRNPSTGGYTWDPESNLNIRWYYTITRGERTPQKIADWADDFIQKRLDYIFVSGINEEQIIDSKVVLDTATGGQHASDHYGVLSVLEID